MLPRPTYNRLKRVLLPLRLAAALLLLLTALIPQRLSPEAMANLEYQIKAAFLHKFTLFSEWPEEASEHHSDQLIIGILGPNPFGGAFDGVVGSVIKEKTLSIKEYPSTAVPSDLKECQVLFVASKMLAEDTTYLKALADLHILTVSDQKGFLQSGGMISLTTLDNQIRFSVNTKPVEAAGITLRSQMLRHASWIIK